MKKKEAAKVAFLDFMKGIKKLPRRISSNEVPKMDNVSKEKFIGDLKEAWEENDMEEKLRKFLDLTEEDPQKNIQNKLDSLIRELGEIKEKYSIGNEEQKKIWKRHKLELEKVVETTHKALEKVKEEVGSAVENQKERYSLLTLCSLCSSLKDWWEEFNKEEHPLIKEFFKVILKSALSEGQELVNSQKQKETDDTQQLETDSMNNLEASENDQEIEAQVEVLPYGASSSSKE